MSALIKLHQVTAASKKDVRRSPWFKALGKKQQSEYLKLHKAHTDKPWHTEHREGLQKFHSELANHHSERVANISHLYPSRSGPLPKLAHQLKSFHSRQHDFHKQEASRWRKKKGK